MDSSSPVTHIGLCAGYGGIELGLHRAIRGMRTVALCEIEAFAVANLVAKMEAGLMDPAPVWPDLKTFPWAAFRDRVDILTGGYPCQPFSSAGKRAGKEDPRHLWPWIADGVRLLRPRFCFFENVEGHISLGLSDVIEDLAGMGYRTTWGIFSASECGAPHQRKRVFILAVSGGIGGASGFSGSIQRDEGKPGESDNCGNKRLAHTECGRLATRRDDTRKQERSEPKHCSAWPSRPGEQQHGWEPPRVVGNSNGINGSAQAEGREHDRQAGSAGEAMGNTMLSRSSSKRSSRWEQSRPWKPSIERKTQPSLGRDADGTADRLDDAELYVSCDNRTDELRLLGNGVVPATAEKAFRVLLQELSNE